MTVNDVLTALGGDELAPPKPETLEARVDDRAHEAPPSLRPTQRSSHRHAPAGHRLEHHAVTGPSPCGLK